MLANPLRRDELEQYALLKAMSLFHTSQCMKLEAPFILEWVYEGSRQRELEKNWFPNMKVLHSQDVPSDANIISSHFVYKVKKDDEKGVDKSSELHNINARLCVRGNKDNERESLRTDAAVACHMAFRLVHCLARLFGMIFAKGYIRGAYTQSGPAVWDVYVRPPRGLQLCTVLWLLTATMYGIVSAGRKYQRALDDVLVRLIGLDFVIGLPQFFHRTENGTPSVFITKYVDYLFVAAQNLEWIQFTEDGIRQAFEWSSWYVNPTPLNINSTSVQQIPDEIAVTMDAMLRELTPVLVSPSRRKHVHSRLTPLRIRHVRSRAGFLNYLSVAVSPFSAFAASFIQQLVPAVTVGGLKQVNRIIRDIKKRMLMITYLRPTPQERTAAHIVTFSDAGFPHVADLKGVAQESYLLGIAYGNSIGSIFHTVSWHSRKKRRMATSSGAVETIAATTAVSSAVHLREVYFTSTGISLPITLAVESRWLHRSLATQRQPRYLSTSTSVHQLRMDYEDAVIDRIVWIAGTTNPAAPLTKPLSGVTAQLLEQLLVNGRLPVAINDLRSYGPALAEES